jgi:hypothetical protein
VRYLLPFICVALALLAAAADRAAEEAAEAERVCAAELPRWRLAADSTALPTPKESVLRWTNPAAGRLYGNTYVWLHKGRPAAAGCLFRNFHPFNTLNAELTALTGAKLVATRDGKPLWQPSGEWKWQPVIGAAAPAATPGQRLVQMRALAAQFTAEVLDTRNNPKGDEQTPRLLPRPLYRYDAAKAGTLDGGLFAFVLGTDPELLLLLECDTAATPAGWRFGVGRMNRDAIRLRRKGRTVWEAASTRKHSPEDPYYYFGLKLPREEPKP